MNNEQPQPGLALDFLGFTASPPGGRAVILIDSEQSAYDFHRGMMRALQRAGVDHCPPWLHAYSMAGSTPDELRRAVQVLCDREAAKNGIHLIIADGIGDFVTDVNNPEESNKVVTEMHDLAIKHDCSSSSSSTKTPRPRRRRRPA